MVAFYGVFTVLFGFLSLTSEEMSASPLVHLTPASMVSPGVIKQ